MTLTEAWKHVLNRVKEAVADSDHPFRFVALATIDKNKRPQQRTVVLRDFSEESTFMIYTDSRSDKVGEIRESDSASLLFYDDKEKLQLRVTGRASIVKAGEEYKRHWDNGGSSSPHSYTSVVTPGSKIENPDEAFNWHLESTPNFCLVKIEAVRMEFLQLDGVRHIRSEKIIRNREEILHWLAP